MHIRVLFSIFYVVYFVCLFSYGVCHLSFYLLSFRSTRRLQDTCCLSLHASWCVSGNFVFLNTVHITALRYDTRYDTCARKPTWVSLIYRTKPTTKKCKNRKTKSSKQICSEITVNSLGNPCSESWRRNAAVGMICRKGFKPGMKEWVGDGIPSNSKYDCW